MSPTMKGWPLVLALGSAAAGVSVAHRAVAEPLRSESAPSAAEQPSDDEDGLTAHVHRVAWVGFGAAAVGVATWAIAGGIALGESASLQDDCPDDVCAADRQGDLDTARTLANVATVGLAVGVFGAIWGVTAVLVSDQDDDAPTTEEAEVSATVRAVVGPGYVGVSGQF